MKPFTLRCPKCGLLGASVAVAFFQCAGCGWFRNYDQLVLGLARSIRAYPITDEQL